jgi:deoxyxylulose-5-phosphate synthase
MFMFDRGRNFFVSAIIGGTPAIAAGVAQGLKKSGSNSRVWCFVGDGIEDTGHFAEAVRYVDGFDLPCTFVIEDDNKAVEVSKKFRWGTDADLDWPDCVVRYKYTKSRPHIRTGNFADISVMKSVMKSDADYFPKVDLDRFSSNEESAYLGTYKQASTDSMTKLGKQGAVFIGYSLIPGDAMGTLSGVPSSQKIEMPIAENLMVGLAIGMSFTGYLPVVYFERHDFMLVAMDAIVNHLDKIHRISHGEFKPKVILKTVVDDGGLFYSGPTHSQDFTKAFKEIVDFEVLDAHSAEDLVDMYEFAMSTPNPVMIVEHKKYF